MEGADQTRLGLDPRRDLSGDQRAAPRSSSTRCTSRSGKRIKYEKVVPGVGPVDKDEIVKGYEVSKGHYVLLDPEEIESREAREPQDARPRPVRRRGRHRGDVFREALLRRSGRRSRRGGLCRPSRCAEGREEDRRRPDGDARPGICRRDQAVGPRHPDGDAALRRRGAQVVGLLPRHRRYQAGPGPARHGVAC